LSEEIIFCLNLYRPILGTNVNEEPTDLLWNILGLFYENRKDEKNFTGDYIRYHQRKEYIWERRKNLNGAKLRVGYVLSAPYLKDVNSEDSISTGGELTNGNVVSS